jgi:hypothetical protein
MGVDDASGRTKERVVIVLDASALGNADAPLLREFPRFRWFDFAHHPELVEGRDLKTIPDASEYHRSPI